MNKYDVFYSVLNKVEVTAASADEARSIVQQNLAAQIEKSEIIDIWVAINGEEQTSHSDKA